MFTKPYTCTATARFVGGPGPAATAAFAQRFVMDHMGMVAVPKGESDCQGTLWFTDSQGRHYRAVWQPFHRKWDISLHAGERTLDLWKQYVMTTEGTWASRERQAFQANKYRF